MHYWRIFFLSCLIVSCHTCIHQRHWWGFFVGVWAQLMAVFLSRLLVSASQDGKLIIWDSYTTNKVQLPTICHFKSLQNNRCDTIYSHSLLMILVPFSIYKREATKTWKDWKVIPTLKTFKKPFTARCFTTYVPVCVYIIYMCPHSIKRNCPLRQIFKVYSCEPKITQFCN